MKSGPVVKMAAAAVATWEGICRTMRNLIGRPARCMCGWRGRISVWQRSRPCPRCGWQWMWQYVEKGKS